MILKRGIRNFVPNIMSQAAEQAKDLWGTERIGNPNVDVGCGSQGPPEQADQRGNDIGPKGK